MIPCALFTSCSGLKPDDLVKSILKVDELPAASNVIENVYSYPWHVDTKYYTADVNLCVTDSRTIGNEEFARAVQAIVITFDTMQKSSFEQVKMWLPYLNEIESPVQVLVCDRSTDDDVISRRSLIGWCLDNSFELVELSPIESDGSDEDDFKESFGVQRIMEALSCHSWPNMIMKEKPSFRSPYFEKLMNDTALSNKSCNEVTHNLSTALTGAVPNGLEDTLKHSTDGNVMTADGTNEADSVRSQPAVASKLPSQQAIDSTLMSAASNDLGPNEENEESFEKLFERLQLMKEKASSLPPDQRKEYAKQMTIQFWKAIGGDDQEIEGLSDSDDESERFFSLN